MSRFATLLLFVLAALAVGPTAFGATCSPTPPKQFKFSALDADAVVARLNFERVAEGFAPLHVSPALTRAAEVRTGGNPFGADLDARDQPLGDAAQRLAALCGYGGDSQGPLIATGAFAPELLESLVDWSDLATVGVAFAEDGDGIDTFAVAFIGYEDDSGVVGNAPPVARADAPSVGFNAISTLAVTANDSDPDGQPLVVISADADRGEVAVVGPHSLEYSPPANYAGPVVITYTISDLYGASATATARVTVRPSSVRFAMRMPAKVSLAGIAEMRRHNNAYQVPFEYDGITLTFPTTDLPATIRLYRLVGAHRVAVGRPQTVVGSYGRNADLAVMHTMLPTRIELGRYVAVATSAGARAEARFAIVR